MSLTSKRVVKQDEKPSEKEIAAEPTAPEETANTESAATEEVVATEEAAATEEVVATEEAAATESAPEEEVAEPESKAVSTVNSAGGLAISGNMVDALAELEEEGLGDLVLGFGAFPTIALNGQMFESSEEHNLGQEFNCIIVRKENKSLFKGYDSDDDEKEEVVYSYGGEITTNGSEVADHLADWKEKGWKTERKEYFDVLVQITSGPMEGKIGILSLPPTSRAAFSGYAVGVKLQHHCKVAETITRVYVGPKVTKAKKDFWPWKFECVGPISE